MGCCDSSAINTSTYAKPQLLPDTVLTYENRCLEKDYEILGALGEGSFGKVLRIRHKATGFERAAKRILVARNSFYIHEEIKILYSLHHPNIVRLLEIYKTSSSVSIVMELCRGGELFDKIRTLSHFSEFQASKYMLDILSALNYMHSLGIVHRDIKPENLIFESDSPSSSLKLVDFGASSYLAPGESLHLNIGTCYYVAPEVLQGNYTHKCDIWSAGVILYLLLCGRPPFCGRSEREIIQKVKEGVVEYRRKDWKHVSQSAQELVKRMLQRNPAMRPEFSEIINHPWLTMSEDTTVVNSKCLKKLTAFRAHCKLERATLAYISSQLISQNELVEINELFQKLDTNKDGKLSRKELRRGLRKHGIPIDAKDLMAKCDIDGNGYLDYSEFLMACMDRSKAMCREKLYEAFKAYDTNGDGVISYDEIRNIVGDDDVQIMELLKKADKNGDGHIDFDEFLEYIAEKK